MLQVNRLVKLCGPYIQSLSIRSLVPADLPDQRNISPDMAGIISGQRQNLNKRAAKKTEILYRGDIKF